MEEQNNVEQDIKMIWAVTLLYLFVASIWIIFSDTVLELFAPDMVLYARLQTYKGWAFVLITGLLFYLYLKPRIESLRKSRNALLEAREELRKSEEDYRRLFEDHSAIKLLIDPDTGKIVQSNHAAAAYYGWSREELSQMRIQQINTLTPEEIKSEMKRAKNRKNICFEFKHRLADGS
jgi:PAS domain-containing protein